MARVWCSDHCKVCGSHFSSTTAFDAHRAGTHEPPNRHCIEPEDVRKQNGEPRLESFTGGCRIGPNVREPKTDVPLWRMVQSDNQRKALLALRAKAQKGKSA